MKAGCKVVGSAVLCLVWLIGCVSADHKEAEISLNGLYGTIAQPPDGDTKAVALILPGSGAVDRNGNAPGANNNSYRLLSEQLVGHGVVTLRTDKRGVGKSLAVGMPESDLRFQHYVDDAIMWSAFLGQKFPDLPVFLIGHSEGALVASVVAQNDSIDRLILLSGIGEKPAAVLQRQVRNTSLSGNDKQLAEQALKRMESGKYIAKVPSTLSGLLRPSVQGYMISLLAMNPANELSKTGIPTLIIHGSTDIQVLPAQARLLQKARPDVSLVFIDGMNHVLKQAPLDRAQNLATYNEPERPLHPALVPRIMEFVEKGSLN